MVNKDLIDLCRLIVAAVGESDNFTISQLRALLLNVVPKLLAELDILTSVLEMLRPSPDTPDQVKVIDAVAEVAEDLKAIAPDLPSFQRQKKSVSRKKRRKGRRK